MTDAHCHVSCGDASVRELLIGRDFSGVHPWESLRDGPTIDVPDVSRRLEEALRDHPNVGVGEIGLDRLKVRHVPPVMRELFSAQLVVALRLGRPVVLHGAKCWGQVVEEIKRKTSGEKVFANPTFLFHGFSRSDGLIPDIVALNGYISVGPSVLNDHAVNYRKLVKKIPLERLLIETDRTQETAENCPSIREVLAKVAELLAIPFGELERLTDENAHRFFMHK